MGIDKILTVPSFFGFDLATGGLIIGYIDLITNGLGIYFSTEEPNSPFYILTLIYLLGTIGLLYAIHEKKPFMMMLDLILSMLFAVFLLIILLLLIFGVAFSDEIADCIKNTSHPLNTYKFRESLFELWAVLTALTAFYWYIISVKYSLYKSMMISEVKKDSANPAVKCVV